jgi:putative SOS response-associated peptidase YedK
MCGRFTLTAASNELAQEFGLAVVPDFPARYNIAPSQPVAVIRQLQNSESPEFRLMRWGLIPRWAKDPSMGSKLINARCETLHEKPSFRSAFKSRRCLIPATGFYEWQRVKGGAKQPYYFHVNDNRIFALAGLWESWNDIETCTIITTDANEMVAPIHQRMPVIITAKDYQVWLDVDNQTPSQLFHLFDPDSVKDLALTPVNSLVNSPTIDTSQCIQPLL